MSRAADAENERAWLAYYESRGEPVPEGGWSGAPGFPQDPETAAADEADRAVKDVMRAARNSKPVAAVEVDPFILLSDVVQREIEWYWHGRLAWANVALIAGDGGVGKSTMAQAIGAGITQGLGPPGGGPGEPGGVVILTSEEDAGSVISPRMQLMGADLKRVTILDEDKSGIRFPSGADILERECVDVGARFVVIDTGPSFMDQGLKSNNEEDVRTFLGSLRMIAVRQRLLVAVLCHLNKDSGRSAGHRIMGGAAWRNVARQVLLVGPPPGEDPRETGDRIMLVEKNNLGVYPSAVAFTLTPAYEDPSRAVVVWGEEVDGVTAQDLVGDPPSAEERSERDEAEDFLREVLADGPILVNELRKAASAAGLSWRTVERAKRDLGAKSIRRGGVGAAGEWWMELVPDAKTATATQDTPKNASGGVLGGLSENPHGQRDHEGSHPLRPPSPPSQGNVAALAAFDDWRDDLPAESDAAGGGS